MHFREKINHYRLYKVHIYLYKENMKQETFTVSPENLIVYKEQPFLKHLPPVVSLGHDCREYDPAPYNHFPFFYLMH